VSKPTLLYCVPYGDDTGAGVRGVAIANRLASRFRIVMLIEGILPLDRAMTVSSEIELVQLPVLGVDRWRSDASVQWLRHSNDPAFSRGTIREVYSRLDPCLVVIENFPFVHSELGNALMSMIADSKSQGSVMPLVVSVTDAIAGGLRAEKSHDDKIAALLNERFDAVLVASDTEFARLEEFFRPCVALTTPVYHTGFVPNDRQNMPSSEARERRVLVSAGDGSRGGRLYRAAVEAHRPLWDVDKLEMTIVAGPSLRSRAGRATFAGAGARAFGARSGRRAREGSLGRVSGRLQHGV
jgi:predicted glycosyltransferase